MTPTELVDELSVKIYESPLCELRRDGIVDDLTRPLSVFMLLTDFVTEVEMNGINDFIGNSTGRYANETVAALELAGCSKQSEQLRQILAIASEAGMTHEAIQADRTGLQAFALTSFAQMHGDKWDAASDAISDIYNEMNLCHIRDQMEKYVTAHEDVFRAARQSASPPSS